MIFRYLCLMLGGGLFLSPSIFANTCQAYGPNIFYFSLKDETPFANIDYNSIPVLIHDESSLGSNTAGWWEILPPYRVEDSAIASFMTPYSNNSFTVRYDIYEPHLSMKGPLVRFEQSACTVDGKNMVQFNSETYAYTISTRSVCSGNKEIPDECYVDYRYRIPGEPPYQVNLNILNNSDQILLNSSGTFTDGLLFLGFNTQCSAEGYSSCGKAALTDIMPGKISPDFIFVGGEDRILDAKLSYLIDDPELTDHHQLVVEIKNGDDLLDRCRARIEPPTIGNIVYQAQTSRVGELDCFVTVTRQE